MPISTLLPGVGPSPDLIGPVAGSYEPLCEIHQVVGPVVGVLFEGVPSVRQLTVAHRFIIDEQFEFLFALGRLYPRFAAFGGTQLDAMALIFLAFWFHLEAPPRG